MSEIHLIIIWSKAEHKRTQILEDVAQKFTILDIYNISWSQNNFSKNLSRFYGENLPKNSHKEKHCGTDTFTCIIVRDIKPNYQIRKTGKGDKVVNINLFDAKQLYRSWTDAGHKIHATDNILESKLQLILLLNKTYKSYLKKTNNFIDEKNRAEDLVGANGWNSFEEVFNVLNETVNYVVLRNFEKLEEELDALHPDVDLLVEKQGLAINVLNAQATTNKSYRVQYNVVIDGKNINFDLRYIGDDYYCARWERYILSQKVQYNYLNVPENKDYFYTLLYHALLHKESISKDYIFRLINMGNSIGIELKLTDFVEDKIMKLLNVYMDENKFNYCEPYDLTVFWNSKLSASRISMKRTLNNVYIMNIRKIKNKIKRLIK